jgi:hypothetical protein
MGGGVDRGSNVDFQGFGVLVGFAMTQPALDEVGVPNLIEKSPGSMEMKWRGSWPVGLLCTVVVTFGRVTSHPSVSCLHFSFLSFKIIPTNFDFNSTATWIATPLEVSALSNPTLAKKSKDPHEKD